MGFIDIFLITISVISSILSLVVTLFVHRTLKRIQRKKLRIVLSAETLNELVSASEKMGGTTKREIVQVQGRRVPPAKERKAVNQKAETA